MAGLYLAMDDPFKDSTSSQYIRLAGTISVMAFVVGYDASKLQDWLRVIPGPGTINARRRESEDEQPSKKKDEPVKKNHQAIHPAFPETIAQGDAKAEAAGDSN